MAYQDRGSHMKTAAGGYAGWFLAGAMLVALIGAAYLYNEGFFEEKDEVSIELSLPNVDIDG